jgi:hypothetical protein
VVNAWSGAAPSRGGIRSVAAVQWRHAAGPLVHGSTATRVRLVDSRVLGGAAARGSAAASLESKAAALFGGGGGGSGLPRRHGESLAKVKLPQQ